MNSDNISKKEFRKNLDILPKILIHKELSLKLSFLGQFLAGGQGQGGGHGPYAPRGPTLQTKKANSDQMDMFFAAFFAYWATLLKIGIKSITD